VHDANTVRRIAALAGLSAGDAVLEVGPGLGSLTLALLPSCGVLHAVELDARLAARLPATVRAHAPEVATRLRVLRADAAALRAEALDPRPDVLVANLPYNVAVPVLLHLLAELPSLRGALVMVQSEVADRLVAAPGSRAYGAPSVKLAWFARAHRAGSVPRSVFWPVPGVDSALVRLETRAPPAEASAEAVFGVVYAAFAQRRKALRSSLAGWAGSPRRAESVLRAAGIDPRARAEALSAGEFAALAAAGECDLEP
jgi:16S rRNA (adenine1518-N6/adenine1519-N6)-dimethyltransferase